MKLKILLENDDNDPAIEWLKRNASTYNAELWMQDGEIFVNGDVSFRSKVKLDKFPYKFKQVTGDFDVSMTGLKSFENFPTVIEDKLILNDMDNLTNLEDIHKHIKEVGVMYINGTVISRNILGLAMINMDDIFLTNAPSKEMGKAFAIMKKYLGKGRAGVIEAQSELINAGLDDFAEM